MFDVGRFRKLIAVEKPEGFLRKALMMILRFVGFFYCATIRLRNFCYDKSIFKSYKADAFVVSVGNITTGGTGKTPFVAWLCNYFTEHDMQVAVLTRGYKMKGSDFADEPAMLAKAAPGAKVIVNPDRVAGAKKAVDEYQAKVIVMDDGFQHRRLKRDIDIVTIDATEPFGFGRILPSGLLREPIESLKRADAVVITRYNQGCPDNTAAVIERIKNIKPGMLIAKAVHKPVRVTVLGGKNVNLDTFANEQIYAFCGIGNPGAFFETLNELSLNIVGTKAYNDHHRYSDDDMCEIYEQARYRKATMVLTTQKDWTKTALFCSDKFDMPFGQLVIELDIIEGKDEILSVLMADEIKN